MHKGWGKHPDAVKDYGFSWLKWLKAGDTLSKSTWTITPQGELASSNPGMTATITSITLSGGVDGHTYLVTNAIETVSGLKDVRAFEIAVVAEAESV